MLESRFAELVEWCRAEETQRLRCENEAKVASAKAVDLEGKHFRLLCRLQTESQHLADAKKAAAAKEGEAQELRKRLDEREQAWTEQTKLHRDAEDERLRLHGVNVQSTAQLDRLKVGCWYGGGGLSLSPFQPFSLPLFLSFFLSLFPSLPLFLSLPLPPFPSFPLSLFTLHPSTPSLQWKLSHALFPPHPPTQAEVARLAQVARSEAEARAHDARVFEIEAAQLRAEAQEQMREAQMLREQLAREAGHRQVSEEARQAVSLNRRRYSKHCHS